MTHLKSAIIRTIKGIRARVRPDVRDALHGFGLFFAVTLIFLSDRFSPRRDREAQPGLRRAALVVSDLSNVRAVTQCAGVDGLSSPRFYGALGVTDR
jgi:hypothetical protein